ncbi:MAG: exosome complex RNA-binding protein Csl4 [archaeon]|nr:exosome complex RNA-binding protein Csl4 [archaeon]
MTSKQVLPGDEIAVEEEYVAAEGTYVRDGKIYASQVGTLVLDDTECIAKVIPCNPPNILKEGDIIYLTIDDCRKTMATATAIAAEGTDRSIGSSTVATIHVSKISPDYTDNVAEEFRKGDLVRGRVISVKPSLQITTKDAHLGVIRAQCGICKTELKAKGNKNLYCPKCRRSQPRKLADDYGDVKI